MASNENLALAYLRPNAHALLLQWIVPALSSSAKLATPGDPGIYYIPFNRQMFESATGHINFSKFNQIKLDWSFTHHNTLQSSYNLYISAKVIDFLIINENTVDLMENIF